MNRRLRHRAISILLCTMMVFAQAVPFSFALDTSDSSDSGGSSASIENTVSVGSPTGSGESDGAGTGNPDSTGNATGPDITTGTGSAENAGNSENSGNAGNTENSDNSENEGSPENPGSSENTVTSPTDGDTAGEDNAGVNNGDTDIIPKDPQKVIDDVNSEIQEEIAAQGDATTDISWYSADATDFYITSAAQLKGLAQLVNNGENFSGKAISLCADIDLSESEWIVPIGITEEYSFKGEFFGNSYEIKGFTLGTKDSPASSKYTGLFGYLEGRIYDLTLSGSMYVSKTTGQVYAGGLAGYANGGYAENVTVNVDVDAESTDGNIYSGGIFGAASSAKVYNSVAGGFVKLASPQGTRGYAGGIAGFADSGITVMNSGYDGTIKATGEKIFAGGLLGYVSGTTQNPAAIINNYNHASIGVTTFDTNNGNGTAGYTGGIAGYVGANADVENCYTIGTIDVNGINAENLYGTDTDTSAGFIAGGVYSDDTTVAENCYALDIDFDKNGNMLNADVTSDADADVDVTADTDTDIDVDAGADADVSVTLKDMLNQWAVSSEAYGLYYWQGNGIMLYPTLESAPEITLPEAVTLELEEVTEEDVSTEPDYSWYCVPVGVDDEGNLKDGSEVTSFTISDIADFMGFVNLVNGTSLPESITYILDGGEVTYKGLKTTSFAGKTIYLTNDLDLSTVCGATGFDADGNYVGTGSSEGAADAEGTAATASKNWTPIGSSTSVLFSGTLDGGPNQHKITNLYINNTSTTQGLFGYASGATFKNFEVSGNIASNGFSGGIIARTSGAVEFDNVTSNVNMNETTLNCHIGGFVGYAGGNVSINSCTNNGNITVNSTSSGYIGGFVGYMSSNSSTLNVSDALNTGDIYATTARVGGIAGYVLSTTNIEFSSNTGNVTGTQYVGGILGYGSSKIVTITACSNSADVTGTSTYAGGIVGYFGTAKHVISDCLVTGNITGSSSSGAIVGYLSSATSSSYGSMTRCFYYSEETVDALTLYGTGKTVTECYYLNGSEGGVVPANESLTVDAEFIASSDGLIKQFNNSFWKLPEGSKYPLLKSADEYINTKYSISVNKSAAGESASSVLITGTSEDSEKSDASEISETDSASVEVISGVSLNIAITLPEAGALTVSSELGASAEPVENENGSITYNYTYNFSDHEDKVFSYYYQKGTDIQDKSEAIIKWFEDPSQNGKYNDEYYHVSTAAELEYISILSNGEYYNEVGNLIKLSDISDGRVSTQSFDGKTIVLEADIDMSTICGSTGFDSYGNYVKNGNYSKNWTPVGTTSAKVFKGNFDGNGKTISGLYIDSTSAYQGFFGYVQGIDIRNIEITGRVTGANFTAGLVGIGYRTDAINISNVTVNVDVDGSNYTGGVMGGYSSDATINIKNAVNEGDISGVGYVGGIIGYSGGGNLYLNQCQNSGKISNSRNSSNSGTGGILGYVSAVTVNSAIIEIQRCNNTGVMSGYISGGIAGNFYFSATNENCTVQNCYATGTFDEPFEDSISGGIVGELASDVLVKNCFYYNTSGSGKPSSAICGDYSELSVTNCYYRMGSSYGALRADTQQEINRDFFSDENGLLSVLGRENGWTLSSGADYPTFVNSDEFAGVKHTLTIKNVGAGTPLDGISVSADGADSVKGTSGSASISATAGTAVTITVTVPEREGYKYVASQALGTASSESADNSTTYTYQVEMKEASQDLLYYYGPETNTDKVPTWGNLRNSNTETYEISEAWQLENLAKLVNGYYYNEVGDKISLSTSEIPTLQQLSSKTFILTNDIDLSQSCGAAGFDEGGNYVGENGTYARNWNAIGYSTSRAYIGVFDGQGHTISNLYISNSADNQGLFGFIYAGSYAGKGIRNLNVTGNVTGGENTGGILGRFQGTTSILATTVLCDMTNCSFSGSVRGKQNVGGILGYGTAVQINNCTFKADSSVSGLNRVGGIAGYLEGAASDCVGCTAEAAAVTAQGDYAGGIAGSITNRTNTNTAIKTSIYNNVSSATVSGHSYVGGIFGELNAASYTISKDYVYALISSASVSGSGDYIGGVIGHGSFTDLTPSILLNENTEAVTSTNAAAKYVGQLAGDISSGEITGSCYIVSDDLEDNSPLAVTETGFAHGEALYIIQQAGQADEANPVYWAQDKEYPVIVSTASQASDTLYKVAVNALSESDNDVVSMAVAHSYLDPWGFRIFGRAGGYYTFVYTNNTIELTSNTADITFAPSGVAQKASSSDAENENVLYKVAVTDSDIDLTYFTYKNVDADTSWYNDSDDSFAVKSEAELAGLRDLVNAGNDFAGKTVTLSKNVDLDSGMAWVPIGNSEHPFAGTFDGANHEISSLYMFRPEYSETGLFSCVTGTVKNLTVSGEISEAGSTIENLGAIAAVNAGTLLNVVSNVKIDSAAKYTGGIVGTNSGRVENADAKSEINSSAQYVGGIAGLNTDSAVISNSTSSAKITADKDTMYAGGAVANNAGSIESTDFTGNIKISAAAGDAGGIAGMNTGDIKSCSVTSAVSISGTALYAGGIAGYHAGGIIEKCDNAGSISVTASRVGGIAGSMIDADILLSHNDGAVTVDNAGVTVYAGGITGYITTASSKANIARCYNTGVVSGTVGNSSYLAGIAAYSGSSAAIASVYESYSATTPAYSISTSSMLGSSVTAATGNAIISYPTKTTTNKTVIQNCYGKVLGTEDKTFEAGTLSGDSDLGFSYVAGGESPTFAYLSDNGNVTLNYQESTLCEVNANSTGGVDYYDSVRNVDSAEALSLMKAALTKDYSSYYDALIRANDGYWYYLDDNGDEQKVLSIAANNSDAENVTFEQNDFSPSTGITYYLKWQTDSASIVYHYMDGTGDNGLEGETTKTVNVGVNSTYTLISPFRDGYQFMGWYTAATGEAGAVNYYGTLISTYSAAEKDVSTDVYAKWQNADVSWYTKAATGTTEYEISDANDLIGLAMIVEGFADGSGKTVKDNFSGKTVKIQASGDRNNPTVIDLDGRGWVLPIGTSDNHFSGTFDGQNGVIQNINITAASSYQGLFGYIEDATIKNVTVSGEVTATATYNALLAGYASGKVTVENVVTNGKIESSSSYTAALFGRVANNAVLTVKDVTNNAAIESSATYTGAVVNVYSTTVTVNLENVSNTGNITGTQYVGGLAGSCYAKTSISNCSNSGNVTGNNNFVAGLMAYCSLAAGTHSGNYNTGDVTAEGKTYVSGLFGYLTLMTASTASSVQTVLCDSYNTGDITGGNCTGGVIAYLVAATYEGINRVYNTGTITSTGGTSNYAGGIIGSAAGNYVTMTDCYNAGEVSSAGYASGFTGSTSSARAKAVNCWNSGNVHGASAAKTGMFVVSTSSGNVTTASLSNCYFLEGCMLTWNDTVGSTIGYNYVKSVTSADMTNGTLAYRLNTNDDVNDNSLVWAQGASQPVFASEGNRAVGKITVESPENTTLEVTSNHDGGFISSLVEGEDESYYLAESGVVLTVSAAAGEECTDGLAYMSVKDKSLNVIYSGSTSAFKAEGLSVNVTLAEKSLTVELTTYPSVITGNPEKNTCTVTLDANGGYFGDDKDNKTTTMEVPYGTTIAELLEMITVTAKRENATSSGWYTDEACGYAADANAFVTGDLTLYAGWSDILQVTFDLGEFKGTIPEGTTWPYVVAVTVGGKVGAAAAPDWTSDQNEDGTLSRHEFLGWFTSPTDENSAYDFNSPVNENMTLYAHWNTTIVREAITEPVTEITNTETFEDFLLSISDGVSYEGETVTLTEDVTTHIGKNIGKFDGTLDGGDHTLTLYGYNTTRFLDTNNGVIENLKIVFGDTMSLDNTGGDSVTTQSSAFCRINNGTIDNCELTVTVEGNGAGFTLLNYGTISNCTLKEGSSVSGGWNTAGIALYNFGTLSGCTTEKGITISGGYYVGGITLGAAWQSNTGSSRDVLIENCVNNADVRNEKVANTSSHMHIGGIAASTYGTGINKYEIANCYNTGTITQDNTTQIIGDNVTGGIVGEMSDVTTVSDCYNSGSVNGGAQQGGIAGNADTGVITNCYSTGDMIPIEGSRSGEDKFGSGGIVGYGGKEITNCYWFGDTFNKASKYSSGMILGNSETGSAPVISNCYYGFVNDDKTDVSSDSHSGSGESQVIFEKTATDFASGEVAWLLETEGGKNTSKHAMKWSMNPKTENYSSASSGISLMSDDEDVDSGDGETTITGNFSITDESNFTSPVLSADSIYKMELEYKEDAPSGVEFDPSGDYMDISGSKLSISAEAGTAENPTESVTGYVAGGTTFVWSMHPDKLIAAAEKYAKEQTDTAAGESYKITASYSFIADSFSNVEVYDMEESELTNLYPSNASDPYPIQDLKVAGYMGLKIELIKPEEPPRHHHSDDVVTETGTGTGTGLGDGTGDGTGTGTGEGEGDGDGTGIGDGTGDGDQNGTGDNPAGTGQLPGGNNNSDAGSPTQTQTPSASDAAQDITTIVVATEPVETELVNEVEDVTEDKLENIEETPVPESGGGGGSEGEEYTEEEEAPEDVTVFEVIQKTVKENPFLMIFVIIVILILLAVGGYSRYRKNKGKMFR